jgi:hypothetical protein
MGLYNAHQFEKQGMKVKIGFMQGAEEWQIDGFLCRFRKIDPSILELEIDRDNADFLIAFLGCIPLPKRCIFNFYRTP